MAVIQLIDLTNSNLPGKILGIDNIFMAPEVVNGEDVTTARADTWSLGIILYLLITGGLKEDNNSET